MGILECFRWYWKGVMVGRLSGACFYGNFIGMKWVMRLWIVCSRHYCGEAACFPFFMPESVVRWTLRWTFRWTHLALQKRNVLIRWTFRWTLLTFLKADKYGKRYKKHLKTCVFYVFKGQNTMLWMYSRGGILKLSFVYRGFGRLAWNLGMRLVW